VLLGLYNCTHHHARNMINMNIIMRNILLLLYPAIVVGGFVHTQCTSDHIASAVGATSHCKPMEKVVKLDMPGNGSFTQMTPQYVIANLCGGGCHSPSHSCVSTMTTTKQVPVMLSSCGVVSGVCDKTCAMVEIQEDTQCRCDCLQEQRECTSDKHSFNKEECRCECKEEEEYTLCRDKGRVWDSKECSCSCPVELVKPCSTGFKFDFESTCSCVPEYSVELSNIVNDQRVVRSDLFDNVQNIEMIIITCLGIIVTIFFIIIINLLNGVRTLRRTVNSLKQELRREGSLISSEHSLL